MYKEKKMFDSTEIIVIFRNQAISYDCSNMKIVPITCTLVYYDQP